MNKILIRFFDISLSLIGLIILLPFFIIIAILIVSDSRGEIFFRQKRVGKNNKDFQIWKFRTMYKNSDGKGLITIGNKDSRITGVGYFLRKYKLDELPQLINVLKGEMSMVGPRPEVRRYVNLYTADQMMVLEIKPGLTDYASIEYANENEILANANDAEKMYIEEVMPAKIRLNMKYVSNPTVKNYFTIIFKTVAKIFSSAT